MALGSKYCGVLNILSGQMLAHPELPDSLITPCVGVIGVLSLNERDLIRVVVEVINELRDPEPEVNISDDEVSCSTIMSHG